MRQGTEGEEKEEKQKEKKNRGVNGGRGRRRRNLFKNIDIGNAIPLKEIKSIIQDSSMIGTWISL